MATQGPAADKGTKPVKAVRPAAPVRVKPTGGVFVGVDIGTHAIKAVEVKGYGAGLTVTAFGIMATPPGAVQMGRVMDPKTLGATLKGFLQKSGIRGTKVVTSVSGADGVVVRVIEVPRMTAAELKTTMHFEVERSIPFPMSDAEMDYQPIEEGPNPNPDPNNPNMEVLFAAAQRSLIMQLLSMYENAKMDPKAVDVEPLAIGRALLNLDKSRGLMGKNVVVVNVGAALTEVGIYKNGILRFPRTIPIAGDSFTRAISDQLGLTMEAAEDEKRRNAVVLMDVLTAGSTAGIGEPFPDAGMEFSFDSPAGGGLGGPLYGTADDSTGGGVRKTGDTTDETPVHSGDTTDQALPLNIDPNDPFAQADIYGVQAGGGGGTPPPGGAAAPVPVPDDPNARRRREIFDALLPVLSEFAMEVRRSVDYFRSRYPSDTVDQILLCGGSARLANLDQYLQYEVGVPTEVADPLKNVNVTAKQLSGLARDEVAPAFAVALGLATYDAVIGIK